MDKSGSMNKEQWDGWIKQTEWILGIAKRRGWNYTSLTIKAPVVEGAFEIVENELNIKYPADFKEVLTKYSSGILMDWQIRGEEPDGEFRSIFCGAGRGYLWDFDTLRADYENLQGWIKGCFSDPDDDYDKVWHGKVPFLDVPNGDMIAFGDKTEKGNQVVYLSHEGSDFHGQILGNSFIEFIDKWTQLGCVGTEDWQFEPFYNYSQKELLADSTTLQRWVEWLEK
jgi:hypothetical protein